MTFHPTGFLFVFCQATLLSPQTFALAVPSTWNALSDLPKAGSFSKFVLQLQDHILREASPDHLP